MDVSWSWWNAQRSHTNYNKPFRGIAVIMLGDFDQQQPIGGSSLPHLAIEFF